MEFGEPLCLEMKLTPFNSIKKYFNTKTIMIIVPHQDDELFLCGTIMGLLKGNRQNVFIVFTTNGDYGNDFNERKIESIKALSKYGINKENIIFLGYGDQYNTPYKHLYHAPNNDVTTSKAGYKETYGEDFCFKQWNVHHEYTIENYIYDIREIIKLILPDIIFSNDLDWHPEHRFTSLILDRVLGEILKENKNYRPYIFKGFIYFIGWDGVSDYRKINLGRTKKPTRSKSFDKRFDVGNPYFKWNDRLCFPIDYQLTLKKKNTLFKAVSKYKFSKNAKRFYESMMNADAIFWQRVTTNAALHATVNVSSGNENYLNDFIIVDLNDITKKNSMDFEASVWRPANSDKQPKIEMVFDQPIIANTIVLYRDIYSYSKECVHYSIEYKYLIDEKEETEIIEGCIKEYDLRVDIDLKKDYMLTDLHIQLDNNSIGFTEIEVNKTQMIQFIKIIVNGDYAYDYHIGEKTDIVDLNLNVYGLKKEDVIVDVIEHIPQKEPIRIKNNKLYIGDRIKKCYIKIFFSKNPEVYDVVCLRR